MAESVFITDVSPRDGLQNERSAITTQQKAELVRLLCASGVDEVEVSSFVSAKWVPQLGDASELFRTLAAEGPELRQQHAQRGRTIFSALAPNEQGMKALLGVNEAARAKVIDKVSLFTAASETFNKRNTNATIAESIERFRPALALAAKEGLWVRVYVSCAFACPFEGEIKPGQVIKVVKQIAGLVSHSEYWPDGPITQGDSFAGVEIAIGDTIGAATAGRTELLFQRLLDAEMAAWFHEFPGANDTGRWPPLVLHLHDTFGRAGECVKAALDLGIRRFDGSAGGLGGCPYASTPTTRAPGNIATETLVDVVHAAGFATGVDVDRLRAAGDFARSLIRPVP
ncbi:MAG: hydroxymethylglutaryl-CoA lyase [Pyrinomonadaceae bacterium]|nr:hydroxymethylglutaryl-CoA lyase [Phycisphaerales bacterium]